MLRQLQLWNGTVEADWRVRVSARARRMAVRVYRDGGVEIVVPPGTAPRRVRAFVAEQRGWIERQRRRSAAAVDWPLPPPMLELPALAERWVCIARGEGGPGAQAGRPQVHAGTGVLELAGDLSDRDGLRRVLLDWLIGRARRGLESPLRALAQQMRLEPARLQIRCQRTRWGSCSRRGTISLNACLLFQRPAVVRYLMVHELSHLRHMNHSARFWEEVARHEPDWRGLDRELLQGWKQVPAWMFR